MTDPQPARAQRSVLAGVTGLLALHPLGSYLFLPALPLVAARYGASAEAAQWSLSALILGFGVTQLLWGALADRHGRRRTLLCGLGLHVAASALSLVASGLAVLLLLRLLQGAGVAAAGIVARALLRDRYPPAACAERLAAAFGGLSVIGIVGPPLAAGLVLTGGLDAMFALSALAGLALMLWVRTSLAEPEPAHAASCSAAPTLQTLMRIAAHPTFRAYAALTCCSYVGHYLFLAGSSALLVGRFGLGLTEYGWLLAAGSAVHLAGTCACRRSLPARGLANTVRRASLLALASGLTMAGLALAGIHAAWAAVLPYFGYLYAHAVHQSCGQAAVMSPFAAAAGLASGLHGTLLPIVAVAAGGALAAPLAQSTLALPLGVATCAMLSASTAWGLVPADHGPAVPRPAANALTS